MGVKKNGKGGGENCAYVALKGDLKQIRLVCRFVFCRNVYWVEKAKNETLRIYELFRTGTMKFEDLLNILNFKMKITTEIFENSFFSIGGGYDIEPLLRFSHLCDFFVNVNLFLTKTKVINYYDALFNVCNDIEVLEKTVIDEFNEDFFFELNDNYLSHLANPDFISVEELTGYQKTFLQAITLEQYAVVYKLRRMSSKRIITFYYCTAEGLASYVALSQNGRFAPKILCTIETGALEHPDGILNRLFAKETMKKPLLWIRGFEPRYSPFRFPNNALDSYGVYKNKVLDFNSKWKCGWSYSPRQKKMERYCKGYVNDDSLTILKKLSLKPEFISEQHQFLFVTLGDELSTIKEKDCVIVSKKTSLNLGDINCNILYWENFTSNYHGWWFFPVQEQFNQLSKKLNTMELKTDTTLHIIPFCLEDEGVAYWNSVKLLNFNTITYLPNMFDFIDLKNAP